MILLLNFNGVMTIGDKYLNIDDDLEIDLEHFCFSFLKFC